MGKQTLQMKLSQRHPETTVDVQANLGKWRKKRAWNAPNDDHSRSIDNLLGVGGESAGL